MAMSSRGLADYENELLTKKAIAKDAIGVFVNESNPVNDLSAEQIILIFNQSVDKKSAQKPYIRALA